MREDPGRRDSDPFSNVVRQPGLNGGGPPLGDSRQRSLMGSLKGHRCVVVTCEDVECVT